MRIATPPGFPAVIPPGSIWIYRNISFVCGKCHGKQPVCVDPCISVSGTLTRFPCLAVNYPLWANHFEMGPDFELENLEQLRYFDVDEVLLVVGDYEPLSLERDIVFLTPSQPPAETINCPAKEGTETWDWARKEHGIAEFLQECKEKCITELPDIIAGIKGLRYRLFGMNGDGLC